MSDELSKEQIGRKIKDIRISRNETMEEFASKVDSNKSNVSRWERGLNIPNSITLNKIAELGNVSVEELLYGSSENYITNILRGTDNVNEGLIPFAINGLQHLGLHYPTKQQAIDEYNKIIEIINDEQSKSQNKRLLGISLKNTKIYLEEFSTQTNKKFELIDKAIEETRKSITSYEKIFEEKVTDQFIQSEIE